jgi:hypothetical protein
MPENGSLRLDLFDVTGQRIAEPVDVVLTRQGDAKHLVARAPGRKSIRIPRLSKGPLEIYRVLVDPPSYLAVSRFVGVPGTGADLRLVLPVDPGKVRSVDFPDFGDLPADTRQLLENSDDVLQFRGQSGEDLYDALDDIRRAGLLNITTKAGATPLVNGRTVRSYLQELTELRGDRFFVSVPKDLREEVKHSAGAGLFTTEPSGLHRPPEGFSHAGSFKTIDRYGNLQVTFFSDGTNWCSDIDIDDAKGLEHVFQVVRNEVTGRPTHPFDIHQILVLHQSLNPGYTLLV